MLNYMMLLGIYVKAKTREFFTSEKGEVNIVAIVVLIGIAVVLALIFREQIESLITTLLTNISKNADEATKKPS